MERLLSGIDRINDRAGNWSKWLVVALTLILTFEVVMRYAFNSPTIWAFDFSYMLGGAFFALGMGYTLLHHSHVRIDIISTRFPVRTRAAIDVLLAATLFFPSFGLLLYHLVPYVYDSWVTGERSLESFWRPPIYPFKAVFLVSVVLLLLQGLASFIRNLCTLASKRKTSWT